MKKSTLLFTHFILVILLMYNPLHAQKIIWSDEFETAGLPDSNKWSYDTGDHGWGNNELQDYKKANLKNSRIENGILIIEAHSEAESKKGYSSARLVTKGKGSWKYAYIEVRAKLPEGRGTWPAIWMLPENNTYGGWPRSGEIDIMEHVGYDPAVVHGTVHTEAFNHSIGTEVGKQVIVPDFNSAFHTYAINWTAEKIDFFIDGKLYFTFENTDKSSAEWPFDQPFHLLLNLAVGGNWGGKEGVDASIWPQRMEVDYVRVYDKMPL